MAGKTVKIVHPDPNKGQPDFMIINEEDYDASVHKLYVDKSEKTKPGPEKDEKPGTHPHPDHKAKK